MDAFRAIWFRKPIFLWILGVTTFALTLLFIHAKFLSFHQFPPAHRVIFFCVMTSTVMMFKPFRNAWLVMLLGWISASGVMVQILLFSNSFISTYDVAELFLLLSCAYLGLLYFQHPYIDTRSNLIGRAERYGVSLEAVFSFGDQSFPSQITCLSSTGFALRRGDIPIGTNLKSAWISIQDISLFSSKVRIVSETPEALFLQVQGFTWSSVIEHLKLYKYISQLRRFQQNGALGFTLLELVAGIAILALLTLCLKMILTY